MSWTPFLHLSRFASEASCNELYYNRLKKETGASGSPIYILPMADTKSYNAVFCLRVDDPVVANAQLEETAKLSGEGNTGVGILRERSFQSLNDAARCWFIQAFQITRN